MAYRDYYNTYSFVKPSNEQYIVPSIQLKCKQNESLSKFDINFNDLKTNDIIHSTLYTCGNSKWIGFLKSQPDILSSYKINVKEEQFTQLTQLKNNKIQESFFTENADNFMIINLNENDYIVYKEDEYVFIQDQSVNPKITEKELNDLVGKHYEHFHVIIIFLFAVVITAISAFGIMKYFESKRKRK